MNINLMPYAIFWGVMTITILGLVFYRRLVSSHEDDSVHLEGNIQKSQEILAHKLTLIDGWGKTLTVIVVVYGIVLAAVYLYEVWNNVPTY